MWTLVAALAALSRPGAVASEEQSALESWHAYTDAAYGFSLSYPPGWEVETAFENSGAEPYLIRRRVAFHDPQGPSIEVDIWHRDPAIPLEDWFREVENITTTVESHALVGGQAAFVLVQSGGCGVPPVFATYLPFEDRVFKIHYHHSSEVGALDLYVQMLRSFSLAGVDTATEAQTALPAFERMVPSTCGTNICPSTCSGGCTFSPVSAGCCGYHAIPKWQCSKECVGSQIGAFKGNCVWWGAYTRPDVGALASGDARYWAVTVRNTGQLPVDRTPKVGDIVVHPGNSPNHVAYVVWVSPDGMNYEMSDMGWCADCGPAPEETKLRSVDADDEFIHCKGDPAIPTVDWQFTDCPFGWTPSKGFSDSQLDGSDWKLDPAEDPYLLSPILSVPADECNSIEIHLAGFALDTRARILFTTASSPDFDESKAVVFTTHNDGTWRPYIVRMSNNPAWQGTITRLRVDPVEAGNSDGSFDYVGIARIRFVDIVPKPPVAWIYLPLALRNYATAPANRAPHIPSEPMPADGATGQAVSLTLSWTGGDPDGDAVTYNVYLDAGDDTPETLVCGQVPTPTCDPGTLLAGMQYYWQVVAADEYSATTTGPVWDFTTIQTGCVEAIANGGFEAGGSWEIPSTAYPASYSTVEARSGDRSMRVGIVDPAGNVYSYSSARQLVSIPAGADSVTLAYWLYPLSGEAVTLAVSPSGVAALGEALLADDAQYVLVLDESNQRLETLLWQRRDDQAWTYHEADLAAYAGRTIKLQFGVFNNGQAGVTGMYVDDVSLVVCSP